MWELIRKRQQYQQVRKPKVADCGMDRTCIEGGPEKQTSLPTPSLTIDSLRERFHLSLSPRRRHPLRPAAPLTVAPSDKLDPKTINGEVCLLTDSPYRILRVSGGNTERRSYRLNICTHLHLYSAEALLKFVRHEVIGALTFIVQLRPQQELNGKVPRHGNREARLRLPSPANYNSLP
jgi:hypothetical protein